jgi:hypothetical protein
MRGTLILVITALVGGAALAQNAPPTSGPTNNPAANATASKPALAAPAQPQPQGHTGPTATTSGGAPASSPQGEFAARNATPAKRSQAGYRSEEIDRRRPIE